MISEYDLPPELVKSKRKINNEFKDLPETKKKEITTKMYLAQIAAVLITIALFSGVIILVY